MNHDDYLDRAIEQVARELTDGAPSQGFAGHVRARLETSPRSAAWVWQMAAAAAVLALVAYFLWPAGDQQPPMQVARTPASAPAAPGRPGITETPGRRSQAVASLARAGTTTGPFGRGRPQPTMRIRIQIDDDAPQLVAIPEPADLTLKPIEIAELTIAPLEPEKESR